MSHAPTLPPGTLIAGKYQLEGLLGQGGMGAVYQATNLAIARRVAIKVLHASLLDRDDVRRRFELEARAAAVINHPGIVDVLDMGETEDGDPFIVMEHLEGQTLRALAKELKGLSPGQAVGVMLPVLDALGAAHAAGIVHRDIKPGNVFVCAKPKVVKLLDFGVSRFGKSTGLTQQGDAIGTPRYMAPEQVLGEPDLGPEADLYSVGAVLYSLLGGQPPHGAGADLAVLARILNSPVAPLASLKPDLPPALCALVDELLVKDRAKRPRDAAAVKARFEALGLDTDTKALFDAAADSARSAALAPTPSSSRWNLKPVPKRRATGESSKPKAARAADETRASERTRNERPPTDEAAALESPARRWPWAVGAALAVVGVAVGGALAAKALRPDDAPAREVPAPTPPAKVQVTLEAQPPHARFQDGDTALACNPCRLEGAPGTRRQVRVFAEGTVSQVLDVRFDESHLERVVLTPLAEAPVKPQEPPATTPTPPPTKKKDGKPGKDGKPFTVIEKNPYE